MPGPFGSIDERDITGPRGTEDLIRSARDLMAKITVGKVVQSSLGKKGRGCKVETPYGVPDIEAYPLGDGYLKLPVPKKGAMLLLIVVGNAFGERIFYLPLDYDFKEINPHPYNLEMESEEDIEIHGKEVRIGASATEPMVLGDTLVSIFESLCDALAAETHSAIGMPTSPPLNAAAYQSIKSQIKLIKAEIGKVR
jgi:hypothetical protein